MWTNTGQSSFMIYNVKLKERMAVSSSNVVCISGKLFHNSLAGPREL